MTTNTDEKDDKSVLAAEYVLGTLDADDRANVHMLMSIDPVFAGQVAGWERRLGALHALVGPIEPPDATWDAIQRRIAGSQPSGQVWLPTAADATAPPSPARPVLWAMESSPLPLSPAAEEAPVVREAANVVSLDRRAQGWRRVAAGVTALAAALIAVVLMRELRPDTMPEAIRRVPRIVEKPVEVVRTVEVVREVPSQRMAEFVAVFQKDDASPSFLLTVDVERRTLSVRKVGAEQENGKSYELWILPAGATAPRSLGLVGEQDFTVHRALAGYDAPTLSNATFGVSLEPVGGSPFGQPTGPVLHGKLIQTTPPAFPQATP